MRPSVACVLLLPLVTSLLSACGDSGDGEEAYREAAEQAVRDAVLTLEDLPDGWTHSETGAATYADLALTGECAQLNRRGAGFPGEVATVDSEPLTGPSAEELVNTVSAFNDTQAAEAAVRLAQELVLQCTVQVEEALNSAIRVAAPDRNVSELIGEIEASVETASFPTFGDETVAYQLRADFSALLVNFEVTGKILIVREGALTGVLIYAVLGDLDQDEEENLAAVLAGKLAKAEEALPG